MEFSYTIFINIPNNNISVQHILGTISEDDFSEDYVILGVRQNRGTSAQAQCHSALTINKLVNLRELMDDTKTVMVIVPFVKILTILAATTLHVAK